MEVVVSSWHENQKDRQKRGWGLMRKRWVASLLALTLVLGVSGLAIGGDTATQTLACEVQAINEISVSGEPVTLAVTAATAGSQPDSVTDDTTTYAITTNGTDKKITGAVDPAMPTGVTLKINLAAPTGAGTSSGDITLAITSADLVTGITQVAETEMKITYTLSATVDAGVVASDTRTVTLTITDGGGA